MYGAVIKHEQQTLCPTDGRIQEANDGNMR